MRIQLLDLLFTTPVAAVVAVTNIRVGNLPVEMVGAAVVALIPAEMLVAALPIPVAVAVDAVVTKPQETQVQAVLAL